jgi:hypothetical protein
MNHRGEAHSETSSAGRRRDRSNRILRACELDRLLAAFAACLASFRGPSTPLDKPDGDRANGDHPNEVQRRVDVDRVVVLRRNEYGDQADHELSDHANAFHRSSSQRDPIGARQISSVANPPRQPAPLRSLRTAKLSMISDESRHIGTTARDCGVTVTLTHPASYCAEPSGSSSFDRQSSSASPAPTRTSRQSRFARSRASRRRPRSPRAHRITAACTRSFASTVSTRRATSPRCRDHGSHFQSAS